MNYLLETLADGDRHAIEPALEERSLASGHVLNEAGARIELAAFPLDAIVSHTAVDDDGTVETGTVGREGVVSVAALMGDGIAFERAIVQVPGRVALVPVAIVRERLDRSAAFRRQVGAYAQAYAAQVAQSVLCNASHPNEARLARWLLMCLDRDGTSGRLPLGTLFLAEMLGISRPSVSVVAGKLQTAGLIRAEPGCISIVDRQGLEEAACDCYRRVRQRFDRLYSGEPAFADK